MDAHFPPSPPAITRECDERGVRLHRDMKRHGYPRDFRRALLSDLRRVGGCSREKVRITVSQFRLDWPQYNFAPFLGFVMLINPYVYASPSTSYQIERSLRFNSADSAYMRRTFGNGNTAKWTLSMWVKKSEVGAAERMLFGSPITPSVGHRLSFGGGATDTIGFYSGAWYYTTAVFRDPTAWMHIVCRFDSAASAGSRLIIWVNGVQQTMTGTEPSAASLINTNTAVHHICGYDTSGTYTLNGYMAEVHFCDGQAYSASDFGETDATTGAWKPKAPNVTYGTTGFWLSFANNTSTTTLGYDDAGGAAGAGAGSNDWTLTNFSVSAGVNNDSFVDTPTNYGTDTGVGGEVRGNYATWNPLHKSATGSQPTFADGNLKLTGVSQGVSLSTIPLSGKVYAELTLTMATYCEYGIGSYTTRGDAGTSGDQWGVYYNGTPYSCEQGIAVTNISGSWSSNGVATTTADIGLIAVDVPNNKIWIGRNRSGTVTWLGGGDPAAGTSPTYSGSGGGGVYSTAVDLSTMPWFVYGAAYSTTVWEANFGQRPFSTTAPSGFKALCTQNLADPDVLLPNDVARSVTYTGNGGSVLLGVPEKRDTASAVVERSLRFNSADSANLSRTFGTATDTKIFTFSAWIKRSRLGGAGDTIFCNATNTCCIVFGGSTWTGAGVDAIGIMANTMATNVSTTRTFKDPTTWFHLVVRVDTTQATAADRVRFYIDGVEAAKSNVNYPTQNSSYGINNSSAHRLGSYGGGTDYFFDGYMADVYFVDGQSLDATNFGEVGSTGAWVPKAWSGTYGTNGFHLDFADNTSTTTLGYDAAGSNDWTLTGFYTGGGVGEDSVVDVPGDYGTDTGVGDEVQGNYATLNPLTVNGGTFSQGNLGYVGATAFKAPLSTIMIPSTGKWQMEVVMTNTPAGAAWANIWSALGVCRPTMATATWDTATTAALVVADVGKYHNFSGSDVNYNGGSALTASDVVTLVVDRDANTFDIYINGTLKTSAPSLGSTAGEDLFFFLAGYGSTRYLSDVNFGQRAFTVDANSKALCTKNVPEPDSYWANGADPDLIWVKGRSGATDHVLVDTTRGPTLGLASNSTGAEAAASTVLSWSKYGARVGSDSKVNTSAATYVAQLFKKQAGFFDIVSYTGNGSARTISHSLGVTPEMMIVKRRTTAGGAWAIYHSGQGATKYAEFSTAAFATNSNRWNDTAPTGSVFSVGTGADVNNNGDTLVNYLFASVPGLCKIGSYTGNGSADGPFVWCGFKPRWLLVKRTDSSGAWDVWDAARSPFNVVDDALVPDTAAVEDVNNANLAVDFLSNGFKMRASHAYVNASGGTYIFMALADTDFKFARAA